MYKLKVIFTIKINHKYGWACKMCTNKAELKTQEHYYITIVLKED